MQNTPIKKNNKLLQNAKDLRKNMTDQERHLWYDYLKSYPVKFYKQRIVDSFIADFYCHKARLVIEIDGARHYCDNGKIYDRERTKIMEHYGIAVIRFSNSEIDEDFEFVCSKINCTIKARLGVNAVGRDGGTTMNES